MIQLFIISAMDITSGSVLLLSLFLLLFRFLDAQRLPTGQECKRNNLSTYQCKKWDECSTGKEIIQNGRAILCGFENSVAKICCPPTTVVRPVTITVKPTTPGTTATTKRVTVPPTTSTTARATTPPLKKNAIAVTERKCQEYSKYRSVNSTVPGLLIGDPDMVITKIDCINVQELIVGGTQAQGKEFPHMALIGYGKNFNSVQWACGGSLISERFVMSAAHCGNTAHGEAKWVLLGALNITSPTYQSKPKVYSIVKRFDHPNYNKPIAYNDITLFQLNTTVEFSAYVRPICLRTSPSIPNTTNGKVSITGWGLTGTIELRSEHLLKATINFIDNDHCQASYGNDAGFPRGFDSNSMVCAGDTITGKDTCSGDSGGPLQIPLPDSYCMWSQVGITSIGPNLCGNMETPAIYTKVANYIDWIQPIVWP